MLEYLSFNKFITPHLLIIAYYFGVIFITALFFAYKKYFLSKIIHLFKLKNQIIIWILLILMFLCMQVCLRVMFEFIIAYFDMHDMLYKLSNSS